MAEDEKTFLCGYRKVPRYGTTAGVAHPSQPTIKYRVEPTDTLAGIALKFGTSMTEIKRLNRLWSQESIYLHEFLHIPVSDHDLKHTEPVARAAAADQPCTFAAAVVEDGTAIPMHCIKSKKPKRRIIESCSSTTVTYPSVGEFFERIDSCIKQISNNVKHMEESYAGKDAIGDDRYVSNGEPKVLFTRCSTQMRTPSSEYVEIRGSGNEHAETPNL